MTKLKPVSTLHKAVDASKQCKYTSETTDDVIAQFFQSLDCARSLSCYLLYKSNEHEQLLELPCDAAMYADMQSFRDSYAATMFLSKSDFLSLADKKARVEKAMSKFHAAEQQCAASNLRIKDSFYNPIKPIIANVLNRARSKIKDILGPFDAEEFVKQSNWGPGSTTKLRGKNVSAHDKYDMENHITCRAYHFIKPWFSEAYPRWSSLLLSHASSGDTLDDAFERVDHNKVITVPKNAKTERVIAIEPGMNSYFQKGVGSMIKQRLMQHRINLKDQSVNQELAKAGSMSNSLATIDFSSASDTIAKEVVLDLLSRCPDWLKVMNSLRCSHGIVDDEIIQWEKYSSMGNGFTFELESLIFFACAYGCCKELGLSTDEVSVFGDDVIIPSGAVDLYIEVCSFLGFTVNSEKSFWDSPFRESCGDYYYLGIDVKPIFLKKRLTDVQSIYKLLNSIRRLAHRRNSHYGCDRKLLSVWKYLRNRVPGALRLIVPEGYGDCGIVGNLDEAQASSEFFYKPHRKANGHEGYNFRALCEIAISKECDGEAVLLARLSRVGMLDIRYMGSLDDSNSAEISSDTVASISFSVVDTPDNRLVFTRAAGNDFELRGTTRKRFLRLGTSTWYNMGSWV